MDKKDGSFIYVPKNLSLKVDKKYGILVFAAASVAAFFMTVPLPGLSADSVFNFAQDIAQEDTTTIRVSGEGSMDLPPDAVILRIEVRGQTFEDLTNVMEYNDSIFEELQSTLDNTGQPGDFQVTRTQDGRVWASQQRTTDPTHSSYAVEFRQNLKIPYEQSAEVLGDIISAGFVVDTLRIIEQVEQKAGAPATNTAIVNIPYGTSVPSCEETNSCYVPYEIVISPGTQVTWTNDDEAAHTVTSGNPEDGPDGLFDSALFMAGATFSHTFESSGSYQYFCMVHPWMIGKVTVSGNAGEQVLQEYGLYAEFAAELRSAPDTIENSLATYQDSVEKLEAIFEKHGIETDGLDRPIRIEERFRGYGEPSYYEGRERFVIRTSVQNLDEIIDVAIKYRAQIEEIRPTYFPSTVESVRAELTEVALNDAKTAVVDLIEPDGLQILGVKSIEVVTDSVVEPGYDGFVIHDVGVNLARNHFGLDPLFVKVQVEFEVGH